MPFAFAGVMLVGGFARGGQLDELAAWLGSVPGAAPAGLGAALTVVLGDPTATLAFWSHDRAGFVDGDGEPVELPAGEAANRRVVVVRRSGLLVGAITYNAVLNPDPGFVQAVARVMAIAVDDRRLTAELLASREALQAALGRVVRAADDERRRIARDLHDGLQARLVLLAVEAQRIARALDRDSPTRPAMLELRGRIDQAADELRRFVQGVMPALLIERGLAAAVTDLAERVPIRTRVTTDVAGRLPAAIESTAYLVVAESLTNAIKHAGARSIDVRVTATDGMAHIDVSDDGDGGANGAGAGLAGLTDRLIALGGRLDVHSAPGGGTTVTARCPYPLHPRVTGSHPPPRPPGFSGRSN